MSKRSRKPRRYGHPLNVLSVRPSDFRPWMEAFIAACGYLTTGEIVRARRLILGVDSVAITQWFHFTAQNAGRDRAVLIASILKTRSAVRPHMERDSRRMPVGVVEEFLYKRDRFRCRYCLTPILSPKLMQLVSVKLDIHLMKGKTNLETHGLFWLHCGSIDHVLAHARGGLSSEENLVISCKACQFGKSNYTLNEVGITLRPPAPEFRTEFGTWSTIVKKLASLQ